VYAGLKNSENEQEVKKKIRLKATPTLLTRVPFFCSQGSSGQLTTIKN
jgi:hypothetical protein